MTTPTPVEPAATRPNPAAMLALRTVLLALSIALLFPNVLVGLADGAWPRFVNAMGAWRWAAWGLTFAAMMVVRFAGSPRR